MPFIVAYLLRLYRTILSLYSCSLDMTIISISSTHCVEVGMIPPLQILETCEYIILHGKRDFRNVTELMMVRWESNPALSQSTQYNHKVLISKSKRQESQRRGWCIVITGWKGRHNKKYRQLLEAAKGKKDKKSVSSRFSGRNTSCQHLVLP